MKIGEGYSEGKGNIKQVNEREYAQENTLNPEIYKVFEFDVSFPEDWKLTIEVFDANGYISDSLVGYTVIDLEDRYYGDPNMTLKRTLDTYRKMYTKELNVIERVRKRDKKQDDRRMELK